MQLLRQQIISHYDEMARSRRFPDNTLLHQTILNLITSRLTGSASLEILDAGSGAGFFGLNLAKIGHRVTLLDPAPETLALAQERSREGACRPVAPVVGAVEHAPFPPESFDVIVCIFVFSHLNDPGRAISELRRVLRRDGRLMISFESKMWHVAAAALCRKYEEAISLMISDPPVVKAYDILPPVRLYTIGEIEGMCSNHGLKITDLTGMRYLTSFQEPLEGVGTTDTEYMLRDDPDARRLEILLTESGELLPLARHFLACCEHQ